MTAPIKLSIHALGGQGGGVLADWLVSLASANGYLVQSTSVPGVAQRTGATVYYLELVPESFTNAVLALMPVPGDVDIVVAAELMEAGRSVLRGLVSADRTTLIASTHRVYAIGEKSAMADGRGDSAKLLGRVRERARRCIAVDMQALAEREGAVISSVLFGAIAGAAVLPFSRDRFEAAIRAGGVAIAANLRGFAAGFAAVTAPEEQPATADAGPPMPTTAAGKRLHARVLAQVPVPAQALALEGVRRLADYQDIAYAERYLDRLGRLAGAAPELVGEVARALALWMSFEDIFRVAQLKTRATRFVRVREDVRAAPDQIVAMTEYLHPRFEELYESLPKPIGAALRDSPLARRLLAPFFRTGRHVRTSSLRWFIVLHLVGRLKKLRRFSLRNEEEQARIDAWLEGLVQAVPSSAELVLELAACQQLIKGYSDTHARGLRNFNRIWDDYSRARARGDAPSALAARIRTLRPAALADEDSETLNAALA